MTAPVTAAAAGPEARLRSMLNPASIAVVGASEDPTKAGGRPLRYLEQLGYDGVIYPVNPSRATVRGLPCYPSLGALPGPVDLCVLAVSAGLIEQSLRDCAAAGISSVIVFASGFAEVGDEGRERQGSLRRIAADHDIALMGPNCLGFVNFGSGAAATFTTALEGRSLPPGRIAFVSQSGAVGAFVLGLAADQGVGFSHFITTGNEAVLGFADYAGALLDDQGTAVIAGYLEGVDGRRLIHLGRRALAAGKPLVLMKVGTSTAGAAASAAHTGKLVGSDGVYSAAFRQFGITRAESVEQLLDFSLVLASGRRPAGRRVGVVSISGGAAILIADWCERLGLDMARFGDATSARLRAVLPWFGSSGNPVDTTGRPLWDEGMLGEALSAVAADPDVDLVLCHVGLAPDTTVRIAAEIEQAARGTGKPVLVTWLPENDPAPQQSLRDAGVPLFIDPVRMTRAAGALADYAEAARRQADSGCAPRAGSPAAGSPAAEPPAGRIITEQAAAGWLRQQGLTVPRGALARTEDEAVAVAREIGYPVCAKLLSPDVPHRSDVGGVKLDLRTAPQVAEAFAAVVAAVPGARVDGVLITEQFPAGLELIVSGFRDPDFGPCVLCGIGGVLAEVLDDTVIRLAPVTAGDGREMLASLRGAALLTGPRGSEPVDVTAAAAAIARVSELIASCPADVTAIEINPLAVYPTGAVVLDALITR
jgi:acyl-CoA synthetase (NDP forming)